MALLKQKMGDTNRRSWAPSRALSAIAATAAVAVAFATPQPARAGGGWYWTPGLCKRVLVSGGVETADGRVFTPQRSFCIGQAATCAWSRDESVRLYRTFYVIMRSHDGVVRTMYLTVTGAKTWRGSNLRLRFRYMGAEDFAAYTSVYANAAARVENQKGCKKGVFGKPSKPSRMTVICGDGSYDGPAPGHQLCYGRGGILAVLP